MEKIALKEYNELKKYLITPLDWFSFFQGWLAYQRWEQEQLAMDRDYQEELNQQEDLRRGLA